MAVCTTASAATAITNPTPNLCQCHFKPLKPTIKLPPSSSPSISSKAEQTATTKWRKTAEIGLIGALAASVVLGFSSSADATRIEYYATTAEPPCEMKVVRSGLAYSDLVPGSGPTAPYNELINVHYTARFGDEVVFDSSYKRGRPLTMRNGVGKVIKGLDQGIFGGDGVPPMQVGGKRKLRIPPELAYGPEPAGCFSGDCNIPANATLLYDIKFVGIYSGNRPL